MTHRDATHDLTRTRRNCCDAHEWPSSSSR